MPAASARMNFDRDDLLSRCHSKDDRSPTAVTARLLKPYAARGGPQQAFDGQGVSARPAGGASGDAARHPWRRGDSTTSQSPSPANVVAARSGSGSAGRPAGSVKVIPACAARSFRRLSSGPTGEADRPLLPAPSRTSRVYAWRCGPRTTSVRATDPAGDVIRQSSIPEPAAASRSRPHSPQATQLLRRRPRDVTPDVTVPSGMGGQADAVLRFHADHGQMLYGYLRRRLPSPSLADDLTQETYLRALRALPTWEDRGYDLGPWLMRIARNLLIDHHKCGRTRRELSSAGHLVRDAADSTSAGPEEQVEEWLDREWLHTALRSLGPDQQLCLTLRFLRGLSLLETSQHLGKSVGAVKSLQHRAVMELRDAAYRDGIATPSRPKVMESRRAAC